MGDVDEGDADALLDFPQLIAHMLAQFQVKGGKRLIEQQDLGFNCKGPGYGHALFLAAGQFTDQFLALVRQGNKLK